ncbi:MAG: nucleotide sugar dehydrogenase [Deltaproteobacteria bacterium]|nr:nucleotide sugar dehydrogenase [Deltaproteobacteria bacterium]MBW2019298.1 nucleotide sugar dehydrogenase [Deltaproteobacteria bacterium]MBW2074081.1 nucleotide sugar dehydrogenase [Deltaproteobacteria bacterium]RLB82589.1 MAG: nucleotide sugar dehydrogenase [Deltaproteobacteria bacterium]
MVSVRLTKIAVIGMGYVGIPVAALLADKKGLDVTGIQRRSQRSGWKIDVLNAGKSPIEGDEPGLETIIRRVVKKGSFRVTDDFSVIQDMDIVLIDVQTPTDGADHKPRYLSLKEVSRHVGTHIKRGTLVVIESTVAPGTTQHVVQPIIERKSGLKAGEGFYLAYSYERVMPGRLLDYIINLPRVVGGVDKVSRDKAVQLYKRIVKAKIYPTDILTAETSKTIENAYRDVNIAFANEMAIVCESLGIDVYAVRDLINARAERHMHLPGIGVGGHCLPKDTWLLNYGAKKYGKFSINAEFVQLARKINDYMPIHATEMIKSALAAETISLRDAKIALLGVAYLEDSDDVRNTPAYDLIRELEAYGAEVVAHDPYVRTFPEAELSRDLDHVLKGADCMVIATKHKPYFNLNLKKIKKWMRTPIIVDGRNVVDRAKAERVGFVYKGIGKG